MKWNNKWYNKLSTVSLILFCFMVFASTASAEVFTHSSNVTVEPGLVAGGGNYLFTATVDNDAGSDDPIHEFRIYYHGEFTDYDCQETPNWTLYLIEAGPEHYCQYVANTEADYIAPGGSKDFMFYATSPDTECCRDLKFETRDPDEFYLYIIKQVCVDKTPPETTKTYGVPHFPDPIVEDEYPHWIAVTTPITLNATDTIGPHDSDINATYYRNIYEGPEGLQGYCESYETCMTWEPCEDPACIGDCIPCQEWEEWDYGTNEPFYKEEESCHIIEYYSVDGVGNEEDVKWQCVFVDDTDPTLWKEHDEGMIEDADADGNFHWMTQDMAIDLYCIDEGPHPVDQVQLWYRTWDDISEQWSAWDDPNGYEAHKTIYFTEDSVHKLQYYCVDAVGNSDGTEADPYEQRYKVDSTPPTITKEMFGNWLGDCPPEDELDECYVADNGTSGVSISVVDGGDVCAVDELDCYYELWWEDQPNEPVATGKFSDYTEVLFTEDSMHELYIYCEDALGNWVEDTEVFLVDSTAPETTKAYGEPYKADPECVAMCKGNIACIHAMCPQWITSGTSVTLTAEDEKVGTEFTYWRNTLVPYEYCWYPDDFCHPIGDQETIVLDFEDLVHDQDTHPLPSDYAGLTWGPDWNYYDWSQPPYYPHSGEIRVFNNYQMEPYVEFPELVTFEGAWFSGQTYQSLQLVGYDGVTPVGTSSVLVLSETPTWLAANFGGEVDKVVVELLGGELDYFVMDDFTYTTEGGGEFNLYEGPFYKAGESCHLIEYYSVDYLGNEEELKYQCVFVDNTAPIGIKTIGEPKIACEDNGIVFSPENREGVEYDGTPEAPVYNGGSPCDGATVPSQCAYVATDALPPFVYDTIVVQGGDPTREGCEHVLILSSGNPMDADTELSTGMGNPGCGLNPDGYGTYDCVQIYGFMPEADSFALAISSEWPEFYQTQYTDWMQIGGTVNMSINSWPVQPSLQLMPQYSPSESGSVTLATLSASQAVDLRVADSGDSVYDTAIIVVPSACFEEPPQPELCGNGEMDPGEECDDGNTENGDGCSSVCLLEVEAVCGNGALEWPEECDDGNTENGDGCDENCEMEWPGCDWWVRDHVTEITLECEDQGDHPVEQETMCYRISFDDPQTPFLTEDYCDEFGGEMLGQWCCVYVGDSPYTFVFMEDSMHDLEFYCMDHLGNTEEETDVEYFKVDSVPPTTTKTYSGPWYIDPASGYEYIDGVTTVVLDAVDGGEICHVDGVETYYQVTLVENDMCMGACHAIHAYEDKEWVFYEGAFGIADESCHLIEFYSKDALGNTEEIKYQCVFVDKTKPETTKTYEGPFFESEGKEWITSDTDVVLNAVDGPVEHPSGVNEIYYKDVYLPDEADWHYCYTDCETWTPSSHEDPEWTPYEGPFNKEPESCHIIEYYSIDNVEKTEEVKWQCVFVDNTAPYPEKTVGDPKTKWDGSDSIFYPEETVHCWDGTENEIECWKVTMLTPINLDCIDPEPHPVDHENVCFKVDFDAEDQTKQYCFNYDGDYNKNGDEFCCVSDVMPEFNFGEESEHELEYYCEDALGNIGPVDIEKFKVEGTIFEIVLNKKWNLVSVPFVLLNNDIEEVFENVEDKIESVWTYDAVTEEWYVYRPNDPDNSNLETIVPGWGYWVSSYEDGVVLLIGGSLMNPVVLPPSKQLVKGWNLIGYYGTSWELYPFMSDYDWVCGDYFEHPWWEKYVYGDKVYCALNSLIDTQEGYPRWSALWSYLNCGYDGPYGHGVWLGLNACADGDLQDKIDRMYAGRGYWIEMDVPDTYSPATTCIWNDDFECIWSGGGIIP